MIRKAESEQLVSDLLPHMGLEVLAKTAHELVLPEKEPDYELKAEKIVVMLFAARAGSTYTGSLIQNLPYFGTVTESLNPRALERERTKLDLTYHTEAVQSIITNRSRQAFGFRCTQIGLASAAVTGLLSQFRDRLSFVLLRRRDVTAQAVSMAKAQLSGKFHSFQDAANKVTVDDYDFDMISNRCAKIASIYERHEKVLELFNATPHTVYYEDIVADPTRFLSGVCDFLDFEMPADLPLETRVAKLPNKINAAWIKRFNKENQGKRRRSFLFR
ncbi:hypothetical protein HFP51_14425 [Parasphingopyxis sp. CP4]|uniref:Stf0 family sulfotransferase n=1 Tax=Parasphingopyxis sp. CP4 TaxID=2724527 RepID=UPI0015A46BDB|nr:Stf0 family sulfotransferase [Parasphingopyxis sp. CP4]QLC23280.1 hypothetical protein HFP51_14425 [Parasphingopyxis sp. CP4]